MKIRDFITAYLKERDMTLADLTAKLGYRSKTSIVRIMNGAVTERSLENFVSKLSKVGGITEKEKADLNEAIELLKWQEDYYPSREILDFLQGKVCGTGTVELECVNPETDAWLIKDVPKAFEEGFRGATEVEILLMNSQYVPIYDKLYRLIREQNAKITHYLMIDENTSRTIHAMNVLFQMMYEPNYSGYLLTTHREDGHKGLLAADLLLANWVSAKGVRCESLILFDEPGHGRLYRSLVPGTLARLLAVPKECYRPLKQSFVTYNKASDYVRFSRECADIEKNRRLFCIKPDISLECIPVEILLAAVREGDLGRAEDFRNVEEMLVEIFTQRNKNAYESRKAHHTIMKRSTMWKFVHTGRLTDHFWGMRNFTMQERAAIMRRLLEHAENNPFFNLYFLKDNQFLRDIEVFCYDGKGLLIVDPNTDYDLSGGHAEVMLDHPEFQRLYKDFFLKHLIREHVISHADTCEFLRSLVEYCENPTPEENE
ncbi:MAG: hypothetical protein E7337_05970 [Clostridiales bacterium]|nr:hypothetical protein [Clostridiales bacterium]